MAYKLYRDGVLINSNVTSPYVDTGLTNDQQYSYQVSQTNVIGEGPKAGPVYATPRAAVAAGTVTVTVNQASTPTTNNHRHAAYAVQRFLRGGGISAAEKSTALDFMGNFVDVITYHWSGGYSNLNSAYQLWGERDFAPTSMATARDWSNSGSRQGLDTAFANLDVLIARRPGAKIVIVLHDIPEAMNNGFTRTSQSTLTPWPQPSFWGQAYGAKLVQDVLNRYGSKILAISYGQEMKGVAGHASTVSARQSFSQGATTLFTIIKNSHPWVERWFPHFNFWSTQSNMTTRANSMDAMIAGGHSLEGNDSAIWVGLLQDMNPALVDRITIDHSICDNGTGDLWAGNYDAVKQRTSMGYHLSRVVNEYMQTYWGLTKPIVSIEDYFDVNQSRQDWATPNEQAALHTSITLNLMKAQWHTYEMRWEPQGDDPLGIASGSNGYIASWFDLNGNPTPQGLAAKDMTLTIPTGSPLYTSTSNDADVEAISSSTTGKVFIANKASTPKSVQVSATNGNLSATTIPALGYVIRTLP